jgi:hypothetical protein
MPEARVITHSQDDARWFREVDHAVERTAAELRLRRSLKAIAWTMAMAFVLGCMFEALLHPVDRLLEWLG